MQSRPVRLLAALTMAALVAGTARAQNLLVNPGFDHSLDGWTTVPNGGATAVWQGPDGDGSTGSGSARVTVPTGVPGNGYDAVSQCVAVTAGTAYTYSAKVRTSAALTLMQPLTIAFFSGTACDGDPLGGFGPAVESPHDGWTGIADVETATAGSHSARITLSGESNGPTEIYELDDIFFGPAITSRGCVADAHTLCLDRDPGDHRFAVQATFSSPPRNVGGTGSAASTASIGITRGGLLWFFDPTNPELLVKVLDGCALTQNFWVYISAGTDVGVELTVRDTFVQGRTYLFRSPDQSAFPNVQDVYAIRCTS